MIFFCCILGFSFCNNRRVDSNSNYPLYNGKRPIGMSSKNFINTEAQEAALAISSNNLKKLRTEIKKNPNVINYRDSFYGETLLNIAILQGRTKAVKILLEEGSDVTLITDSFHSFGSNAVIDAVCLESIPNEILKMVLDYGGDPNSYTQGYELNNIREYVPLRRSALSYAAGNGDLGKVKLLLKYGADINFAPEGDISPLKFALLCGGMETTYLLLINGADYNEKFKVYVDSQDSEYKYETILEKLRRETLEIGSREYEYKMKIVEFLKERGLDYRTTPIDENTLTEIKRLYPDSWQEYIKIY